MGKLIKANFRKKEWKEMPESRWAKLREFNFIAWIQGAIILFSISSLGYLLYLACTIGKIK